MPEISSGFVKRLLKKGYRESSIRDVLRESGYSQREIEATFSEIAPKKQVQKPVPEPVETEKPVAKPARIPNYKRVMYASFVAELLLIAFVATAIPALEPMEFSSGTPVGSTVQNVLTDCAEDLDCFQREAADCGAALVRQQIGGNMLQFAAYDCVITKRITSFGPAEPPEVIEAVSGKTMQCPYEKGYLPSSLLNGLAAGIEYCEGPLKEAMYAIAGWS